MKKLMKGNEAIAEAAILAGCRYFFGYPITPQNQIPEYMSKRMPQVGGCFLQAESEVAAINMVYGAAGAGARVMTSSSSPGVSLKQEGISYMVGAELPCVIVNIVRGGPGLGGIQPAQSDYYQATRGGGHGDYRLCVLAPSSVQEAVTLTQEAFDIADRHRNPVMVLGDGLIGQMMEPVDMDAAMAYQPARDLPPKTWAATGHVPTDEAPRAVINSLYIDPKVLEQHNLKLQAKYDALSARECRWQEENLQDAEIVLVAYGTTSRIARSAMRRCREKGVKVGLLRPVTLWPFPAAAIQQTLPTARHYLCVEMSLGQMVDDVRLAVEGARPVHFYGRTGGMVPTVGELVEQIEALAGRSHPMSDFEKKLEDLADQVGQTMGQLGDKLNTMGRKLDEKLSSPETQQKVEEVKQSVASAAEKAKAGILKGAESLAGALGGVVEGIRKELADIEAQQQAQEAEEAAQETAEQAAAGQEAAQRQSADPDQSPPEDDPTPLKGADE